MPFDFIEQQLLENTFPHFRELLGKKVEVKKKDGTRYVGKLSFAGFNTNLNNKLQVTIDKMPIFDININTLKLYTK